ncbi:Similar to hypothetical protein [Botryotinia fuckeliana]; acc. no. CCD55490 [Pyronema omphalodes CBS 100304]|uniref:Ubiquitin-like domain-containing protein n=1 Tax=Pyronema omphalodes (strain CBS 100304) TaxID=1076935 RepID=U4L7U0_PYROM|nr:Similar to hypothetical protein [Botryotinia fuckeliana]; acc. no. CCD55490 [Pyronema omphalodes CBS 100304]
MTELSFTRDFLKLVSNRPQHLKRDYIQDQRTLPATVPYTLPRTLPPPPKRQCIESGDSTVSLTLKPLRPTPGLSPQTIPASTSSTIATLKKQYSQATSIDISRIKLLLKAKPLADVKTIGELGLADGAVITVMLMAGGAGAAASGAEGAAEAEAAVGAGEKEKALKGEKFWGELKEFLESRLGEGTEEQPEEVLKAFRKAWKA